jgi:hypothetical protein
MLKNISKLELSIASKVFNFMCDMDAPLNDVKEALFQFQKYVGQIEDQIKQQQEQKAQENKVVVPDEIAVPAEQPKA